MIYIFKWHDDHSSSEGLTAKNGGKHHFDLFLNLKSSSKKPFNSKSFDTKSGEVFQTEWISFHTLVSWSLKGKDEKSQKNLDKIIISEFVTKKDHEHDFNLFIYLNYSIK
ncbi:hypothetical protein [Mycoplasmoides pneumoniae]|uniref:hypothetical protein n=1 Tax=Mycoplasmoides pneumoniae TaxID=2104 RepID=UPI0013761EF6|nr:hypothetical protein [Mycoplasmoides pneumoniae]QHR05022.1 hypothetical protein FA921_00310 [Mycoplasmoides pneumoniae]QHR09232.1 hypothetical protein FA927_00310 [Mycoplasmoides pneumoniae]GLL58208.1 hypothetical protein Y1241N_2550 [Mycoplasmoides pneumoniae]GLL60167.1 hypothetical protein OA571N_0490 [Mycoplasmoides pneumoniae]